MLSSEGEVRDRLRGLSTGADDYVGKPYDAAYLIARTEELIRMRREEPAGDAATVLVIDDSITFRRALHDALTGAGYVVREAASGEEGLRLAGASRPDAVIVDAGLPGMDGADVIRQLRLDVALRRVPCLLLTASEAPEIELRAFEAGADAFARKDVDPSLVLARLAALLRQSGTALPVAEPLRTLRGMRKLLLVDPAGHGAQGADAALREDGYDLIRVEGIAEAMAVLAVQPVDCILLHAERADDATCQWCRELTAAPAGRDIPILVLGRGHPRREAIEALEAGADDYVPASTEVDVLRARVAAQIRRKQVEDDTRSVREELLRRELEATEARAARQVAELRAALVEGLERKNRELEAFSYSVSHDLRAPLRAISGFSRILRDQMSGGLDPRAKDYLGRVCIEAQRMGERIDALLELAQLGRTELHRQRVDLTGMAEDVLHALRRDADRQVEVVVHRGVEADVDPRMVRAVLDNLIGNAWKFTARTERARIEFGMRESSPPVYFVRDNGPGFDMRLAERLFRPFQRLHSDDDVPGTGVGLATVQRIVERHGGRIWAESGADGTTFSFTLAGDRSSGSA